MNRQRAKSRVLFLLLLAVGVFLCCKAGELVTLYVWGEQTKATVTGAFEERHSRGGSTYNLLYEFQTPDKSLYTGLDSHHKNIHKYQRIPILYLPRYPKLNRIDMTVSAFILFCALWSIPGLILLVLSVRGLWRVKSPELEADDPGVLVASILYGMLACLFGLGAYTLGVPGLIELGVTQSPEETTPVPPEGIAGNTSGNLNNGGYYAQAGEWIIYVDLKSDHGKGSRDIYRIRADGSGKEKLADGPAQWLNLIGDDVYYVRWQAERGDTIHRLSLNDGAMKLLLSDRVMSLCAQGEWLYFTLEYDDEKLYRSRLDGSTMQQLNRDTSRNINIVGPWIYYVNASDHDRLYRIHTNGTDRQKLTDYAVQEPVAHGEWVYFRNESANGVITRFRPADRDTIELGIQNAHWLNVDDTFLYYSDYDKDSALFRMPLEGEVPEVIYPHPAGGLHTLGTWLYFGAGDDFLSRDPMRLKLIPKGKPEAFPPMKDL